MRENATADGGKTRRWYSRPHLNYEHTIHCSVNKRASGRGRPRARPPARPNALHICMHSTVIIEKGGGGGCCSNVKADRRRGGGRNEAQRLASPSHSDSVGHSFPPSLCRFLSPSPRPLLPLSPFLIRNSNRPTDRPTSMHDVLSPASWHCSPPPTRGRGRHAARRRQPRIQFHSTWPSGRPPAPSARLKGSFLCHHCHTRAIKRNSMTLTGKVVWR